MSARALAWLREGSLWSVNGTQLKINARSLCVHGDTPGAVTLARALREALAQARVEVRAFA